MGWDNNCNTIGIYYPPVSSKMTRKSHIELPSKMGPQKSHRTAYGKPSSKMGPPRVQPTENTGISWFICNILMCFGINASSPNHDAQLHNPSGGFVQTYLLFTSISGLASMISFTLGPRWAAEGYVELYGPSTKYLRNYIRIWYEPWKIPWELFGFVWKWGIPPIIAI